MFWGYKPLYRFTLWIADISNNCGSPHWSLHVQAYGDILHLWITDVLKHALCRERKQMGYTKTLSERNGSSETKNISANSTALLLKDAKELKKIVSCLRNTDKSLFMMWLKRYFASRWIPAQISVRFLFKWQVLSMSVLLLSITYSASRLIERGILLF